jgi:MFS family permease
MKTGSSHRITTLTWFVMAALALSGQLAWAIENSWFNAFVYDKITPDPRPVAWMVACSAITATLTTLIMGTLSDRTHSRWGRRRPYIFLGYLLWGLATILFPTVAYIKVTSIAVVMVVIADSVMTYFGSTANDAAFNAWTADVASRDTRGRVEGVLNLSLFIAQIVATAAAGIFIEKFGYFIFFYAIGGIVMLVGLVAGSLLREAPPPPGEPQHRSFWAEFADLFNLDTLRHNRDLFILLLVIMINSIGFQVYFPYLIVFLQNFKGFSLTEYSIIGGTIMLGSALLAIPFGILADRWSKRSMIVISTLFGSFGGVLFSLATSLPLVTITGLLTFPFSVAGFSVASMSWLKDLLPEQNRGKFLGIRMIFWIAIPMVLGPWIGSTLIRHYGIPTITNGQAGFIPVPVIYWVGCAISLLALIPLFFLRDRKKTD